MSDGCSREAQAAMRHLHHEVRSGLGQTLGYSEMLQEDLEDRDQGDLLEDFNKIQVAAVFCCSTKARNSRFNIYENRVTALILDLRQFATKTKCHRNRRQPRFALL